MAHVARTIRRPWRIAAIGFALVAVAPLTSCAGFEPSRPQYGVAAAPPLPASAPVLSFDPNSAIADVDGTVVVQLTGRSLMFQGEGEITLSSVEVPEGAELRAVSANGHQAALFRHGPGDRSTVTIVDRSQTAARPQVHEFGFDGLVEPEAFSTNGSVLYVIDHQVSDMPGAYRVRPLNLDTGRLETILGPTKVPLLEDMNGAGRRQVWSPGGSRLNTLYIRQTHHHHDDGVGHAHGEPGTDGFVHVLDLDEEWAYCLDLPTNFGEGDLATTALAVSSDGNTIAVADLTAEEIAFASTSDLVITHVLPLPDFDFGDDLHVGMTSEAVILGTDTTVQWFDAATMAPRGEAVELDERLMAFSPGGYDVLAWIEGATRGPVQLRPPAAISASG